MKLPRSARALMSRTLYDVVLLKPGMSAKLRTKFAVFESWFIKRTAALVSVILFQKNCEVGTATPPFAVFGSIVVDDLKVVPDMPL